MALAGGLALFGLLLQSGPSLAGPAVADGEVSLRALGLTALRLDARTPRVTVPFTLPSPTGDSDAWYVVRLSANLILTGQAGATALVASTNDRVVNQVELRGRGGETKLFYNGYVTGPHTELISGRVVRVSYENYVQLKGVKAGRNELLLLLDQFDGRLVERADIDVDRTAIVMTSIHPEQLRLKVPVEPVVIPQGSVRRIPVVLERRGQRPDKAAAISFSVPKGLLVENQAYGEAGPVSKGMNSFVDVSAPETGSFTVGVDVKGGYNDPSALVRVLVVPAKNDGARYAVGLGLLLPGVWLITRSVRARPSRGRRRREVSS